MEVTEKDPRVRVFDDQYGKNYEFKPANKTETGKFMNIERENSAFQNRDERSYQVGME